MVLLCQSNSDNEHIEYSAKPEKSKTKTPDLRKILDVLRCIV